MAQLETWYKQDLKKPLVVHRHADVFNQDSRGNLIGVEIYSDGEPVTLSGSIDGYCLLSDGTTVSAVGANRTGNKASILIPQTAYNVPGPITITIKNTDGNDITTLCAVVGLVRQSVSGNLVQPGDIVTDWSQSINSQLQAVQDAADNVGAIVAAPFAENTAYVVGNYVTYNGNLYRITADHAAGVTWANTAKTQCTVGTELYDLKSATTQLYDALVSDEFSITWYQGAIRNNGENTANSKYVRTDFISFATYDFVRFMPYTFEYFIVEYSGNTVGTFTKIITAVNRKGDFIFTPKSGYYYRFCVRKDGSTDITPEYADLTNIKIYGVKDMNKRVFSLADTVPIPQNAYLNSYTTPGRYSSVATSVTSTLHNLPEEITSDGFDLIVTHTSEHPISGYIRQIFIRNNISDNVMFVRYYSGTEWGNWEKVHDTKQTFLEIKDLSLIAEGTDLNNIVEYGSYYCNNAKRSKTLSHVPLFIDSGFSLYVLNTHGSGTPNTYIRQIIFGNKAGTASIYTRVKTTEWSGWELLASSSFVETPNITLPGSLLPEFNSSQAKKTIIVATSNVAHYYAKGSSKEQYLNTIPLMKEKHRRFIQNNEIDILFLQECEDFIDEEKEVSAFDTLYAGLFDEDHDVRPSGEYSTNPDPYAYKILNRLGLDTDTTQVTVTPATAGYDKNGGFNWCIVTISGVGDVLLINVQNFAHKEAARSNDRLKYLTELATFIGTKTYDYFIIAGDFNVWDTTASGGRDDRADLISFCSSISGIPANGGSFGWFSTFSQEEDLHTFDNIIVSDNIRIEKVDCDQMIVPSGNYWSDHTPVLAKISFT